MAEQRNGLADRGATCAPSHPSHGLLALKVSHPPCSFAGGGISDRCTNARRLPRRANRACPSCTNCPSCYSAAPSPACRTTPKHFTFDAIPRPRRGTFRDRHERWARDAMDAFGAQDERTGKRTAKPCGPGIPTLMSSLQVTLQTTETTKPGLRGEHGISRKTIVQGMPDCFGEPVVTTLACFSLSHARLRVHRAPGIPCTLLKVSRVARKSSGERIAPRECSVASPV
jgi:hypothetical protein